MKKVLIAILSFTYLPMQAQIKRDTSYVGIFLKNLYDLSPADNSFGADFYLWSNSTDSDALFKQLEIINAKKLDEYSSFNDKDNRSFVTYENCKAQLSHNWNLKSYPFDKQRLEIVIEAQEAVDFMYLSEDQNSFQIAKKLRIPGWDITKSFTIEELATYPSDFGYHHIEIRDKRFNHLSFVIELSRQSWGLYFKLFSGLYIAFLVSFLAFFVRPDYVDPRFGLSVGGLFASVANKYVVDANIPPTISFSFVDMVHFLSFVFIFGTLVISSISLRLYSQGKIERRKALDKMASKVILFSYFILNGVLIIFVI